MERKNVGKVTEKEQEANRKEGEEKEEEEQEQQQEWHPKLVVRDPFTRIVLLPKF
jgi:hypothetical protein